MDRELQQFLEAMENRIVDRVVERVVEPVAALVMQRFEGRMDAVEDRMKVYVDRKVEDMETKLVGEFWKWGRTSDMRTRQALVDTGSLNERVMAVEDRISALERKSA